MTKTPKRPRDPNQLTKASLEAEAVALTQAQAREIDSRLVMLDENPGDGKDAFEVLADLRRRFG